MSRAARETKALPRLRSGDDLPALRPGDFLVREAAPLPEPGPIRDVLAEQAAARAERAQVAMETAAQSYAERVAGVVLARLKGPRARRGTRYWSDRVKSAENRGDGVTSAPTSPVAEVKALDGDYIVPDTLVTEISDVMRPVALRVALDASQDAFDRLADQLPTADSFPDDAGPFAVDQELLGDLLDEALEDLLGGAARYAEGLRKAILTGDDEGVEIDDLVERVGEAATRGGNWLRLSARTLGTALAARSALETARRLGVTHTQWISRRDPRVRPTHVLADGQVRPIGEGFEVGRHRLEYPGDPTGLPETAEEVQNCRCGLLFAKPDEVFTQALGDIFTSAAMGADDPALAELMTRVRAAELYLPVSGADAFGLPNLASAVETPQSVVGYRELAVALDVVPGQQVLLPAGTVLGLAAPAMLTRTTLAVLVPVRTAVGVSGGALVLTEATTVEVLASSDVGVQGLMRA